MIAYFLIQAITGMKSNISANIFIFLDAGIHKMLLSNANKINTNTRTHFQATSTFISQA